MIDYNAASRTYDNTRTHSDALIDRFRRIPDIPSMFRELRRVLKGCGLLCVVTESHAQIDGRFYNRYFPSLAENEKRRYPDVAEVIARAHDAGLISVEVETFSALMPSQVSETFIRNVAEKNYSMFRLLSDHEFTAGLQTLTSDLGRSFESSSAGETMLWFGKSVQPVPGDHQQAQLAGTLRPSGSGGP